MKYSTRSRWLPTSLITVALIMSLSSCSTLFGHHGYFRDRGEDYVKADEIPPTKFPPSVNPNTISELYVIPPITNEYVDAETEFDVPKPDFQSAMNRSQVKIQKLDQQRWIVMNTSPSEVWPRVQQFFVQNKLNIASAVPASGKIETAWLMVKGDPSAHDRYQVSLEQGIRPGSSEIHVLEMSVTGDILGRGQINWPAVSTDTEKEKWLLDLLAKSLTEEDKSGASLLAQSVGGSRKVEFIQLFQAEPFLVFSFDKARTWASVGGALAQFPFVVTNSNADRGFYEVTYDPTPLDTDKPGFFCRITGCVGRAKARREHNLQHYRVQLDDSDNSRIKVVVKSVVGDALPYHDAERILNLIKNQLV